MARGKTKTWKNLLFGYKIQQVLPYLLIVTAVIGLLASFTLTVEHIHLIKNPDYKPTCSINPILSCGPVMKSPTATMFGFPNPLIGLVSFGAQLLLGVIMLAGARMKSWFWKLWGVQVLGSVLFTLFLIYQSVFVIGALCIYCITVWIALSFSAWYTLQYMLVEGHIGNLKSPMTKLVRKYQHDVILIWFLFLAGLIFWEFWYYFGPKLGF